MNTKFISEIEVCTTELKPGDFVHFDYIDPKYQITSARAGVVEKQIEKDDAVLLFDFSKNDYREFKHIAIENPYLMQFTKTPMPAAPAKNLNYWLLRLKGLFNAS